MKNMKLAFGIIAMALVLVTACEEENTNQVVENGSATISGVAFVDLTELNNTSVINDENLEFVPTGTVLYATFNTEDLVLVPSDYATYADMIVTTTVQANGEYSFTVPANSQVFSVDITSDDFTDEFVEVDEIADTVLTYNKIFTLPEVTVGGIHDGAIRLENLYFE